MGRVDFTLQLSDETRAAKAMGYELHISPKHAVEICTELRGRKLEDAKRILEQVIKLERPIPMRRFKKKVAHRSEIGGPGRYPEKAAREILKILKDAEANAKYKGLDPSNMVIVHMCAKKGRTIKGYMPRAYGRASPKNVDTVTVEVILEAAHEGEETSA